MALLLTYFIPIDWLIYRIRKGRSFINLGLNLKGLIFWPDSVLILILINLISVAASKLHFNDLGTYEHAQPYSMTILVVSVVCEENLP